MAGINANIGDTGFSSTIRRVHQVSGSGQEDTHAFGGLAVTADTAKELALHRRDGTVNLTVAEINLYLNDYVVATGAASGVKVQLHWADTSGEIVTTATSATRLCEFLYEGQALMIIMPKKSKSKLWLLSNKTGTYQVNIRYLYEVE